MPETPGGGWFLDDSPPYGPKKDAPKKPEKKPAPKPWPNVKRKD